MERDFVLYFIKLRTSSLYMEGPKVVGLRTELAY